MPLAAGSKLGSYEILAPIGAGGMGEVYRARDTKLGRDVAIKVLPEEFARDRQRLDRFEREARLLAQLNHSNVATLHGLEEHDGQKFLIMEFVEGETLAERIAKGPIPIDEALSLFVQITAGLEAAHEKGIVHRDLKPANIKITHSGVVKILDFGLAKALDAAPPSMAGAEELSDLPTRTRETQLGVIQGTAPYMSPEQARGTPTGKRGDVWSFGCILFEMLTGVRAFRSDTVSETLALVLEHEPEWDLLPNNMPARLQALCRRCLEKSVDRRFGSITETRAALEQIRSRPPAPSRIVVATISAVLVVALGLFAVSTWRQGDSRGSSAPRFVRPVQLTSSMGIEDYPSWSPDGRTIAYAATQEGLLGNWDLWVLQVDSGQTANRTADDLGDARSPAWSPDGSLIAFWSDRDGGGCFVMPSIGGVARRVGAANQSRFGNPQWSSDGRQLACLSRDETLGRIVEIVDLASRESTRVKLPGIRASRYDLSWSRDGRFFAYIDTDMLGNSGAQLRVLRVADGVTFPITGEETSAWSPSWSKDSAHLYFVSNRTGSMDWWRQQLSEDGRPVGEPQALTAGLELRHASLSPNGDRVVYSKGKRIANLWRVPILADRAATWNDAEQVTFDQAMIEAVDISPDGERALVSSDRGGNHDIWIKEIENAGWAQVTTDRADDFAPRWSPDGREVAFFSLRSGNRDIWIQPLEGGPARAITTHPASDFWPSWSPDGTRVVFHSHRADPSVQIFIAPATGGDPYPITGDGIRSQANWSPDGKHMIFLLWDDMRVSRYWMMPAEGGEAELLTGPASFARFSRDGERLLYVGNEERAGNLWSVSMADRSDRPITDFSGRPGTLGSWSLATDASYVYFTWEEELGDLWVMDVVDDARE